MTDREMAIPLGEYILQLRCQIEILKAIVIAHGIATPDQASREDLAKLIPQEDELEIRRFFASQLEELKRTLSDQTPASGAIRSLQNHFLGK